MQSTLGTGTAVPSFDPLITANTSLEHYAEPLSNTVLEGVQVLHANTIIGNFGFTQAFPTGTVFTFGLDNNRGTSNSPFTFLNPQISTYYRAGFEQQLLAGFGTGPNLRYLRIARNNRRISDAAFKLQVITTVTQIATPYWDLVSAYEDEQVKSSSLDFANHTLDIARKQLELQAIPAIDVMKDEVEVANREQDVSIARSQLQFQQLLMKNAITKNLDNTQLEAMPVRPTDLSTVSGAGVAALGAAPTDDIVNQALNNRVELFESVVDLQSRSLSRQAAENALLPTLALTAYYAGSGLAGPVNPAAGVTSSSPLGFGGALGNAFNNSAHDYHVGVALDVPLRNRVAKSDQYRAELESRQAELRLVQLRKQIRIEVRNAQLGRHHRSTGRGTAVQASDRGRSIPYPGNAGDPAQARGLPSPHRPHLCRRDGGPAVPRVQWRAHRPQLHPRHHLRPRRIELLAAIRERDPQVPVIVMTAWANVELAVEAMRSGASDFVPKPWDNLRLLTILRTQPVLHQTQRRAQWLEQRTASECAPSRMKPSCRASRL